MKTLLSPTGFFLGRLPFALAVRIIFWGAKFARRNLLPAASKTGSRVNVLGGLIDPLVPWLWVQHWLKWHYPARNDEQKFSTDEEKKSRATPATSDETAWHWQRV
jgi:hypothetical protein